MNDKITIRLVETEEIKNEQLAFFESQHGNCNHSEMVVFEELHCLERKGQIYVAEDAKGKVLAIVRGWKNTEGDILMKEYTIGSEKAMIIAEAMRNLIMAKFNK